jgi:hypothetical protein
MTDEQINAAIAKECGFVGWDEFYVNKDGPKFRFWDYPKDWTGPSREPWVPLFCTDLNAMHEAEKVLAPKNWNRFSEKWWNYYHHLSDGDVCKTIHATARQRAEAFLRTLGKWEEGE